MAARRVFAATGGVLLQRMEAIVGNQVALVACYRYVGGAGSSGGGVFATRGALQAQVGGGTFPTADHSPHGMPTDGRTLVAPAPAEELHAMKAKAAEMEKELHAMKAKAAEMEKELHAMKAEMEANAAEMEANAAKMEAKAAKMEEELAAMNSALTGRSCPDGFDPLMFAIFTEEAQSDKAAFKKRISEEKQRISEEKQRISEEKQRISEKEQRISEEKQRISEEKQRISEKEKLILQLAHPTAGTDASAVTSVPPPTSVAPIPAPTPGAMGELPAGVTAEVEVVEIKDGVLGIDGAKLLVRNRYYPAVWKMLCSALGIKQKSILVVLGQPGIGKTVGLGNYAVLRCLQELPDAVVAVAEFARSYRVVSTHAGTIRCTLFESETAFEHHVLTLDGARPLFFVHDVKTALGDRDFTVRYSCIRKFLQHFATMCVMILSSPQMGNYSIADKLGIVCDIVALPTWSTEELVAGGFIPDRSDPRLALCGGIPRSYTRTDEATRQRQISAIAAFDIMNMRRLEFSGSCSSRLVQLLPNAKFTGFDMMAPVSREAAAVIAGRFGSQLHAHFVATLAQHGAFDGHLVEWWLLSLLSLVAPSPASTSPPRCNLVLQLHPISGGSSAGKPIMLEYKPECVHHGIINFEGSTVSRMLQEIAKLKLAPNNQQLPEHVVLIPAAPNFPVVDAVVLSRSAKQPQWSMVAFQCTVATDHPVAADAAEELIAGLTTQNVELTHFVFVGLGGGSKHRGVTKQQTTANKKPFFPSKQHWMDVAVVTTKEKAT